MKRACWLVVCSGLLAGCASAPKGPAAARVRDGELVRLEDRARHVFEREAAAQAANLYAGVLRRARALDDAEEIGNAAYNLAVCLVAAGRYDEAAGFLRESAKELGRARVNLADVLVVQARVAQMRGEAEEALRFAGEVFANQGSDPGPAHRAEVALLRGEVACARGRTDQARVLWGEARALLRANPEQSLVAGVERLGGVILGLEGRPERGAQALDGGGGAGGAGGRLLKRGGGWGGAGDAWRLAGKERLAADRLFRAARSGLAQGVREPATRWQRQAVELAERAGDEVLAREARRLGAEILAPEGDGVR